MMLKMHSGSRRRATVPPLHLCRAAVAAAGVGMTSDGEDASRPMQHSASVGSLGSASVASVAASSAALEDLPLAAVADLPSVPGCFRCALTGAIMEDPVVLDDGRVCDNDAVTSLSDYRGKVERHSPLQVAIRAYFELREETQRRQDDWQAFVARRERKVARALSLRQRQVQGLRSLVEQTRQFARDVKVTCRAESSSASTDVSTSDAGHSTRTSSPAHAAATTDLLTFKIGPAPRGSPTVSTSPMRAVVQPQRSSTWSTLLSGMMFART